LTAADDQISAVSLDGKGGSDTLTVKVAAAPAALNGVTNVETIIFKEAATNNTTITAVNTLVASGATLTVDASSFTTKTLTFNGAAETDGSFKITGGALVDVLTGGAGADTLTGNGALDNLTGGGGNDQFVLNKATAGNKVTITNFGVASGDSDVFALSKTAFTEAPAVGTALTTSAVPGAINANTTILVDLAATIDGIAALGAVRFAYSTDTKELRYDADGFNNGAASIVIAQTTNGLTLAGGLSGNNFAIVA